jgi:SAM-dependent methyltransferase
VSALKSVAKSLRRPFRAVFPATAWAMEYWRAARKVGSKRGERDRLFDRFLADCAGKPGLQISVKDEIGRKFGPNWVSVDKYDTRAVIDRNDDIEDLKFPDASFDAAVCWSVLEHVPHPQAAIAELRRVLKPGGLIWVQLPFLFPYHESPQDYWRVTPDGLRVWMADFEEIACACDYWADTKLIAATYFYGRKRGPAAP